MPYGQAGSVNRKTDPEPTGKNEMRRYEILLIPGPRSDCRRSVPKADSGKPTRRLLPPFATEFVDASTQFLHGVAELLDFRTEGLQLAFRTSWPARRHV